MATQNKNTDELVLQLINKVKEKKKEISAAQKPRWLTNCSLGYDPDSVQGRVNIQTVTDTNRLVDLYAFLDCKSEYYAVAAETLKVPAKTKYMGYSFDDWKKDIKARVEQININKKKEELQVLEERLDKLVTPEQRRELELAEILEQLGKE